MRARTLALALSLSCGTDGEDTGDPTLASTSTLGSTTSASSEGSSGGTSGAGTLATGESSSTAAASSDESGSTGTGAPAPTMLYATSGTRILGWRIADDGTLVEPTSLELGSELGPLAHDRDGTRLYVGRWDGDEIGTLAIDPRSGALTELGTVAVGGAAVYLTVDRDDAHVLLADYNGGRVSSWPVLEGGTLGGRAIAAVDVGGHPHAIVLAPAGDFAFAPNLESGAVEQLVYDAQSGALMQNQPAQAFGPGGAGPRHMTFAEDARFAWVINELGDSITRWRYDASTGLLAEPATVDTLPDGVDGSQNACADLHLAPGGAFLYGSNRGHDTLAMFAVSPTEGTLTWIGEVPTEAHPRSFAISPDGRFLYAAGRDSGRLARYAIDEAGMLAPLESIDAGPAPGWVEPVTLPD